MPFSLTNASITLSVIALTLSISVMGWFLPPSAAVSAEVVKTQIAE